MKYTIELTDNQKGQMDLLIEMAHKHIGFNPKLEMDIPCPMEESPAYKKGFEDGNKIADKNFKEIQDSACDVAYNKGIEDLAHAMKVYFPLNSKQRLDYFGTNIQTERYARENPKDLIAMAKAYEEQKKAEKESIKVGDEVIDSDGDKGIITSVDYESIAILFNDGSTGIFYDTTFKKTGRHFDEVEQLLNKLKGDEG